MLFDGDVCTVKGVFTNEANSELKDFMVSKQNFVGFGVNPTRASEGDVIQAVYALTKVLSTTTNLTKNIEFS